MSRNIFVPKQLPDEHRYTVPVNENTGGSVTLEIISIFNDRPRFRRVQFCRWLRNKFPDLDRKTTSLVIREMGFTDLECQS